MSGISARTPLRTTAFPTLGLEMTSVRILMTVLTLGAAGAGYVYLQPPPPPGEPYYPKPSRPSLNEWRQDATAKVAPSRVPTKDLVYRIREQSRSALDDFASQHGGDADAPGEDAFLRLRQVAQSVVRSTLDTEQMHPSIGSPGAKRINPLTPTLSPQSRGEGVEATSAETETGLVATDEQGKEDAPVSQVSRIGGNRAIQSATKNVAKRDVPQWKVVGKTTEGRPMHSRHLGENGTRTLVIAGLNGTDRTAVRWLEMLADELVGRPEFLTNNEVVFFRAGNPDGLLRNESNNSRNVPLNRNFPSRRYRSTSDMPAFAVPAGEMETRVMLDTLYTFRPRRVIHLTATTGRSQVLHNKSAGNLAAEFERSTKIPVFPLDAEQLPGSIEDFADGTLDAAVLSLRLNVGNDWQKAWTTLKPHVLSAVVGKALDDEDSIFDPDRSPIPPGSIEPVSARPRRMGYEELPAPPN